MARYDEKIAQRARIACEKWRQYFKYNIDQYHKLHDFVLGRQWTDDEEDMLKTFKKVPLQFNKLGTLINSLLGEQQQNTPQLEILPIGNCDEETAQIRSAVVKEFTLSADAKTAYQVSAKQACVGGYGALFNNRDYVHDMSFEQDIKIDYFKDATLCYWDVSAERIDKTDGMMCGAITRMSRKRFKSEYGKKTEKNIVGKNRITQSEEEIALAIDPAVGDDPFTWSNDDSITILDHFERKYTKDTLYKLSNGEILDQEQMDDLIESSKEVAKERQLQELLSMGQEMQQQPPEQMQQEQQPQQMPMPGMEQQQGMQQQPGQQLELQSSPMPEPSKEVDNESDNDIMTLYYEGEPVRIEDKKSIKRSKIMHYKIAGDYVLDETQFPSDDLPIVFMDQDSYYDKQGKQVCRSFIIDAVDAQRYLNYLGTQSAFILKVGRYDQFIGSKKNVQSLDTQQAWRDPYNVKGILTYDESPSGAKPEQIRPPELSQSLIQQYQRAIDDMYTSTGLYPARLGQQGNEVSGVAVDARSKQSSYSTYVVKNSINRAISSCGRIVNQMIPRVYDTERVINMMTPDEGRKNVTVNQPMDEYGERIKNDIRKGTFKVVLQAGLSYEGQKEQELQALRDVLQFDPANFKLVADLYAENLSLSNTIEIRNRFRTLVPPEIIEIGKTGKMPPQQPQQPSPEQQMAQMQQQQMQMTAQYQQQQIEIKKQELQLKAQQQQIDMQIEMQKLKAAEIEVAGQIEEQKLRYLAETQRTEQDVSIAHANNLVKILTSKIPQPTNNTR